MFSTPGRTRTHVLLIKSQVLLPTELRSQSCSVNGIRTTEAVWQQIYSLPSLTIEYTSMLFVELRGVEQRSQQILFRVPLTTAVLTEVLHCDFTLTADVKISLYVLF